MLEQITPIILTYNEAPNIGRVIERLDWAKDIVVVDSYSTDGTPDIVENFRNARILQREFDNHASQWNYALNSTNITTPWVLALDSDYILSDGFKDELERLKPETPIIGYQASFIYCINGKPLRGTLYPPVTVLYKRENAKYQQEGHTQRIVLPGEFGTLESKIYHDDRKPLGSWLQAQDRYMALEAKLIKGSEWRELGFGDKLRRLILPAPFITFLYCLFIKGGLLDGKAGLYYALQRMLAEIILSLKLLELAFSSDKNNKNL